MQLLFPKPHLEAVGQIMMAPHHQLRNTAINPQFYNMKQYSPNMGYIPPVLSHRLSLPLQPRPRRRRSNHSLVATMDPIAVARRNERERNRVKQVNDGFDALRKRVPFLPDRKKLSKVEILRCAMLYMTDLQCVIEEFDRNNPHHEKLNVSNSDQSGGSLSDDSSATYVILDDGDEDSDDLSVTSECSSKSV